MRFGISQTLFAFVALTGSATSALAQDAPASAPAAESTVRDQEVSQINGQLVPVGDKNQYLYDFKRWNVSTNPLSAIVGVYGLSLSYGVTQNIAIRGDVNYYDPVFNSDDMSIQGFQAGISAPIYLRRTYQGAFVEPGVIVEHFESKTDDVTAEATVFGPSVSVGWHWTWDSGLNIALAAGVGRNFSDDKNADGSTNDEIFGTGYLRIGYAF